MSAPTLSTSTTALSTTQRRTVTEQIDKLAWLLDNAIRIPGTNYRIGFEGVIGLIPGIGDLIGLVLSGFLIVQAGRLGTPRSTLLHMVFIAGIESLIGLIPIVGDLFDFVWKGNQRNVKLMHEAMDDPHGVAARSRKTLAVIFSMAFLSLIVLTIVVAVLGVWMWQWVMGLIGG